jgi:hypothetical protein
MKKILFIAIAAGVAVLMASCHFGNGFSVFTDDSDDGRQVTTMEVNNGDYSIKVKYAGDIAFTEDETAIKSISPGGCLKYWRNGRKLIAESNKDGVITWQLYDGSSKINPNSAPAQKLVAFAIKDLINLGFDAKGRVDRLYKKGGAVAVLDEIDFLQNEWVKTVYFEKLLDTKYLTPAEMNQTAKSIQSGVGGDYEKGQLLGKYAEAFMASPQTSPAYLQAVASIGGDYEKAGTLQAILKLPLAKGQLNQVLTIAGTIDGSYEKSNVLKAVIEKTGLSQENCDKLLEVTGTVDGDYEKAGILNSLAESDSLSSESFGKLLFVTGHIGGDYEKAGVLKKIADQNIATDDQWINLINATAQVGGANEKKDVLVSIAKKMPRNDKVRAAYMDAAKTIGADYEYSEALKAAE